MIGPEDFEPTNLGIDYYLEAFSNLATCRNNSGMGGASPIPFTAILDYAKLIGESDISEFCYLIRQMDDEYLIHNQPKEQKVKAKQNGKRN
jgi:hypothetical protein